MPSARSRSRGVARRLGEAAAQQLERGLELALVVLLGRRAAIELAVDAERSSWRSIRSAPQASSRRRSSAKRCGVAGVVEVALLEQLRDRTVDLRRLDALGGEQARQLGDRALAPVERAPGDVARVLQARLGIVQPLAGRRGRGSGAPRRRPAAGDHAAAPRPRRRGRTSASSSRSIGVTRSWPMPSAA